MSGALWAVCFAREATVVLPWIALSPLLLVMSQTDGKWGAFLHGLGTWLASLYWLVPTLGSYGDLPTAVAVALLVLLAAYLAGFSWAFAWLGGGVWRRGGTLALVALPALWVALEWLRAHLLSGFPWNLAGYAWVEWPGALELTAWIGSYGLSYLVLFANTGVAMAAFRRRWEPLVPGLLLPLLVLALGARWSRPEPVGRGFAPVRIVQPNIPNLVTWNDEVVRRSYARLMRLTHLACDEAGALIVWPESAAWPYTWERDAQLRHDVGGVVERGCSLLFNSPTFRDGGVFNSALLVGPQGSRRYDKLHLVPYGEYVPMGEVLPFVGHLARNAGQFSPGTEMRLVPWRSESLGVAICFEVIFPGEVAQRVRSGATILVTVTNDAWYGDTSAPWQHFRAARFRAAENRRPLLRGAITGVSGVIAADGSVEDRLDVGAQGILDARMVGSRELSPYTRRPWLVPLLACLIGAFAIFRAKGVKK